MTTFDAILEERGKQRFQCEEGSVSTLLLDQARTRLAGRVAIGRNAGAPMQLEIGMVEDLSFNAWASTKDGVDVIAINGGVYPTLVGVFRALSHVRTFFPHVGDVNVVEEPGPSPFLASDAAQRALLADFPAHPDPEREELARRLASLAMVAIVEHEFAHICNGHVDWVREQSGERHIVEMASGSRSNIDPLDRQTLEWDADCAAVQDVLQAALEPEVATVDGIRTWHVSDTNRLGTREDGVRATIAALFVTHAFYASEDDIFGLADAERTHPNPSVRLHAVVRTAAHVLHFRTGSEDEAEIKGCVTAAIAVLKAWDAIFPVQGGVKRHPYASQSVIDAYTAAITIYKERWARMHPALDRLKRGGRLAPPEYQPNPAFANVRRDNNN